MGGISNPRNLAKLGTYLNNVLLVGLLRRFLNRDSLLVRVVRILGDRSRHRSLHRKDQVSLLVTLRVSSSLSTFCLRRRYMKAISATRLGLASGQSLRELRPIACPFVPTSSRCGYRSRSDLCRRTRCRFCFICLFFCFLHFALF